MGDGNVRYRSRAAAERVLAGERCHSERAIWGAMERRVEVIRA